VNEDLRFPKTNIFRILEFSPANFSGFFPGKKTPAGFLKNFPGVIFSQNSRVEKIGRPFLFFIALGAKKDVTRAFVFLAVRRELKGAVDGLMCDYPNSSTCCTKENPAMFLA